MKTVRPSSYDRTVVISWLTAELHVPEGAFDRDGAFWEAVTSFSRSAAQGQEDVATLVPSVGDPYLRVRSISGETDRCQLEIHTDAPETVAATASDNGGSVVAETDEVTFVRSPGGLRFGVVVSHGGRQRPAPRLWPQGQRSLVDQLCIDIPWSLFDTECAFWAALTGLEQREGGRGFRFLPRPAGLPLRLLLQRLDDETGPVRSHLDLACSAVELECVRHEQLGATVAYEGDVWTTLFDPAGIVYCVTQRDPDTGTL